MFKQLTRPHPGLGIEDLRPARQAKNLTLRAAAQALSVDPITISRTERGQFLTPKSSTATATGSRPLDIYRSFSPFPTPKGQSGQRSYTTSRTDPAQGASRVRRVNYQYRFVRHERDDRSINPLMNPAACPPG